jgi:folate-binding Fe-S cluster repair protein YgfZ
MMQGSQGRVLYDVFIYAKSPGYLIEYDSCSSSGPPLLALLKRYILRSKVKLRDVSDEYDVWAAWGRDEEAGRKWHWSRSGAVEPVWNADNWPWGTEEAELNDRRAVGMGKRMLVRKGDKRKISEIKLLVSIGLKATVE